MRRLFHILAKALSTILYPLFIPTYGIALFCYAYHIQVRQLPVIWYVIAICVTFLYTCLLPMIGIWILIRQKRVTDWQIANSKERTLPYMLTSIGFALWCHLMFNTLDAPPYICWPVLGATIAIFIVAVINHAWKISAHLTAFGGLLGGLLCFCLGVGILPSWGVLTGWLGLTLLLMYARLFLDAHTSTQVVAGWLLGLICTLLPYWIYFYVV